MAETTQDKAYHRIDASEQSCGRVASQIANLLRGKNKATFERHVDNGDFVIVENVEKMQFTGKKLDQKKYFRYSGYQGGLKEESLKKLWKNDPAEVLRRSVYQMLPGNKLRNNIMKRLIIKQEKNKKG